MGLSHSNESPNLAQKTRPYSNHQKKRTCRIVNFAVPADHRINWKHVKRRISTSTLLENWKKLWNIKVTIIIIVIGAFSTVEKGLLKYWMTLKLEDEWRPPKLQYRWERPEFWEESWRLEETCCHSNSSDRPKEG